MAREVANKIMEQLSLRKMTQKELAQATNITESAISHYIKGDSYPARSKLNKNSESTGDNNRLSVRTGVFSE